MLAGACDALLPFQGSARRDGPGAGNSVDATLDQRWAGGGPAGEAAAADRACLVDAPGGGDIGGDAPLPDLLAPAPDRTAAADAAGPDRGGAKAPDAAGPDQGGAKAPDAAGPPTPDLPRSDASSVATACAPGLATPVWDSGNGVVICQDPTASPTNLCQASKLCNAAAGWRLCPASTYKARVAGATTPPKSGAWIASCVRDDGLDQAPSDAACKCLNKSVASAPISWLCESGAAAFSTLESYVGLQSETTCHRVGQNAPATEGWWIAKGARYSLYRAVCCQ